MGFSAANRAFCPPCWHRRSKDRLRLAEIHGVDAHDLLAGLLVDAGFVDALAAPLDGAAFFGFSANASSTNSRTERVSPVGQHEIVGRIRLQNPMHAFDVGRAWVEIAEIELSSIVWGHK